MKSKGFATGIWVFGGCPDRFCPRGYKEDVPLEKALDAIAAVEDLKGVIMHYPNPINEESAERIKRELSARGLSLASCDVDLFGDPMFALGGLMSEDEKVRRRAIELSKKAMDMAEYFGADVMNLWPGQDGFDYPFQIDYRAQWNLLIEALREIASHNPRVKLSLEYKLREPRTHSTIATSGLALFLAREVGLPNVGVTIDLGHSFNCKESPGNVVALLDRFGKLFALHLNDNFRDWDDDMAVGTVHFFETLEFLYYLFHSNYEGWLGLDIFPYRENPSLACTVSIENIKMMLGVVEKIDVAALREYQKRADALGAFRYIRSLL
ncbi:MAG: TIM barrel protein [Candidatus Caldatribacterium sp.]|nr:TIM barrel protein [Candidatus Caldatribacterium sp.]